MMSFRSDPSKDQIPPAKRNCKVNTDHKVVFVPKVHTFKPFGTKT